MGQSEQTYNWTTLDELNCVRSTYLGRSYRHKQELHTIELSERIRLIRNYINVAQRRDWTGLGVMVDAATVILQAMDYLEELLKQQRQQRTLLVDPVVVLPLRMHDTKYVKKRGTRQ